MNLQTGYGKRSLLLAFLLIANFFLINATMAITVIKNLQVEYTTTPIGIDVKAPRLICMGRSNLDRWERR